MVRGDVGPILHLDLVCSEGHTFSLQRIVSPTEESTQIRAWSLVALLKQVQMILELTVEPGEPSRQGFI